VIEENRGCNVMIKDDDMLKKIKVIYVGKIIKKNGFYSLKLINGR
jgi:hypothetical protein